MNLQVEASSGWRSGFLPNNESKGGKIMTLGKKGLKECTAEVAQTANQAFGSNRNVQYIFVSSVV